MLQKRKQDEVTKVLAKKTQEDEFREDTYSLKKT